MLYHMDDAGRILLDSQRLGECGVQSGHTIHVIKQFPGQVSTICANSSHELQRPRSHFNAGDLLDNGEGEQIGWKYAQKPY